MSSSASSSQPADAAVDAAGRRGVPRTADAWLREGDEERELQGREFAAEDVKPWPSPVTGADALDGAVAVFDAYVFAPAEHLDVMALWCCWTHVFDSFGIAPLLDLTSPTMRCGKTTAAHVAGRLVHKPLMSSNLTPASLFRAVESWQPTDH